MPPHTDVGRAPRLLRTVYDCAVFYSSLLVLGLICLSWSVIALPLYVLLPRRAGTAAGRRGIMAGFRIYTGWLTLVRAYRLDLRAIDALRGGPACVLAPNHPCMIDALLILTRHPNVVCVMKSEVLKNVFLGSGARLARYVCNEPPMAMIREAVAELQHGSVLLLFPEGTRSVRAPINALKASIGVVAKSSRLIHRILARGGRCCAAQRCPSSIVRASVGASSRPQTCANLWRSSRPITAMSSLAPCNQSGWVSRQAHRQADTRSERAFGDAPRSYPEL